MSLYCLASLLVARGDKKQPTYCIQQKINSRANDDAINVHPIEFFLGEYNHLWSFYLCCHVFGVRIHIIGVFLYIVAGGILAGLNHTRYDLSFQVFGITLFDTKVHDVHHRIPQSNYGQYTMFWDHVFGSFRYVNPPKNDTPKNILCCLSQEEQQKFRALFLSHAFLFVFYPRCILL